MDLESAKITLEEMRKVYPTATPEKKAELKEEAKRIKSEFSFCRQCHEITEPGVWFCSKECQEAYYPPKQSPLKQRMATLASQLHEDAKNSAFEAAKTIFNHK